MSSTQCSNHSTVTPLLGSTTVIIVVLLVCGALAFGISAGIWHYYEETEIVQKEFVFGKRIIGYFTYFDSTEITKNQLSKLTHAVYAYLQMNPDGTIEFNSKREEIRFSDLAKNSKRVTPNVKVLFSIGGYENSQYFPMVIDDPKKKRGFIDSIVLFIKKHQIDGVDLFWRWPGESDKFKYSAFLKELRQRLKKENRNYILSIEVPAVVNHLEDGFDMDEILEHVDFVNVMCMDFYGPWPSKWGTPAGPSAPLYAGVGGRKNFNVDYTMKHYSCEAKQSSKFNIVITFSTRLWKNVKETVQPGDEVIRHVELIDGKVEGIADMTQWTVEHEKWKSFPATWDEATKSSYIWNPDNKTYLTFESNQSMRAKISYANEKNLGGVWIWSVGMDDEKNTLLNTLRSNEFWSTTDEKTVRYEC